FRQKTGIRLAPLHLLIQTPHLSKHNRRLKLSHAQIPADIIMLVPASGANTAYIGRRPGTVSYLFGIEQNLAAFSGVDVLVRLKAERTGIANGTNAATFPF